MVFEGKDRLLASSGTKWDLSLQERNPADMKLSGECILLSSVSSQQNLEGRTLEPLACHSSWTDHVIALRQISVTAPCYGSILFRK